MKGPGKPGDTVYWGPVNRGFTAHVPKSSNFRASVFSGLWGGNHQPKHYNSFPTEVLSEKVKTSPSADKKQLFGELESAVPVTTFLFLAKLFAKNRQHIIDLATGTYVHSLC